MKPLLAAVAALCLSFSLIPTASAEPFLLSEPRAVPGPAPNDVVVGGSETGFLLAGTASNKPIAVAIDEAGNAQLGVRLLGSGNASSVGEPQFAGDRWLVPVAPDFLNPERFLIAEIGLDGSLLREPRSFDLPRRGHVEIAEGANGLLVVATRSEGVNRYTLTARTLSRDLGTRGPEVVLPGNVVFSGGPFRTFRVVRDGDGYAIAYATDSGLLVARLNAEGSLVGGPVVVVTAPAVVVPDLIAVSGRLVVAWAERDNAGRWMIRVTNVSGGEVGSISTLATVEGVHAPALFIRRVGSDLVAVWQGINDGGGRRIGSEILRQNVTAEGTPSGEKSEVPRQRDFEVLVGAASSGEDLLLVSELHLVGVGTSLNGTVMQSPALAVTRPVRLSYAEPKSLVMTASVEGTTTAAWIEHSTVGDTLWAGSFDRDGTRRSLRELRSLAGIIRSADISTGSGNTLLIWHEGTTVFGAFLNEDASFREEPFVITVDKFLSLLDPRVTWDGSSFVVVWTPNYDLAAAYISPSGMVQQLGVIASFPPFNTPSFRFVTPSVAANVHGAVVTVYAQESNACNPLLGCPEPKNHLAFVRIDSTGNPARIEMQVVDSHPMPDIATDGRDFVAIWRTSTDIRTRVISGPLLSSTERVLFNWQSAFFPHIAWSGTQYVAAWGYQTGDANNIAATMLDRTASPLGPVRIVRNIGGFYDVAAFPGDALLGWVGGITEPKGSEAVFGEFFRDLDVVTSRRRSINRR